MPKISSGEEKRFRGGDIIYRDSITLEYEFKKHLAAAYFRFGM